MGYVRRNTTKPIHQHAKRTNLKNSIDLPDDAMNGSMTRSLSNWEWAELKELHEQKGLPEPTDRTLGAFVAIAGRCPEFYNGKFWITPPFLKDPA